MARLGLVLDGGRVDCDASSLFLGSLIDLSIFGKIGESSVGSESYCCLARTLVMAEVRVVLPWSMWPMVPTLR